MSKSIPEVVEGSLYYIPYTEFQQVRASDIPEEQRAAIFADMCRLNALYMITGAGSGHIGSSFSGLDIVSWLLLEEMDEGDVFFSSKGHDAPGLYSALIGLGKLDFNLIHKLRRIDGLPGHPDIGVPGIVTNTGSLGMGISKAKGIVFANRINNRSGRVFVMTGDGELQEGQIWESLISAANHGLHEIIAIVDHNSLQSDTYVKTVSDLGNLEAKLQAFGWRVERCNGNDIGALSTTLASLQGDIRPKFIIADTIKGKGVSFMEHTSLDSDVAMYQFHSGAPDSDSYRLATEEIIERLHHRVANFEEIAIDVEIVKHDVAALPSENTQRLIPAYTRALMVQARKHSNLVVLDGDLILDTGLIPFQQKFPERFFECGIAEQDMVSVAGGMALNGLIPVVHSFACFLSSRPNEQIYNNATEKTKIIYVGSLAGVVPGGPGHSHQAVRDISALAAIPSLTLVEPSCEDEVGPLFDWCINKAPGSCYLRLVSLPWDIPYRLPQRYRPHLGRGVTLVEGTDVAVIAYGPIMLSAAVEASSVLASEANLSIKVINLPWLNQVDANWLKDSIGTCRFVQCLENHYAIGGQGDLIARTVTNSGSIAITVKILGVEGIPPSGTNTQVLEYEKLDPLGIAEAIVSGWAEHT